MMPQTDRSEACLQRWHKEIDNLLQKLVPKTDALCSSLYDAANYALFSGGKRMRPLLCLAAAEALGNKAKLALYPACALEFVHTYSMIHDDLPCMDNDDYRRGRPTVHKQFTEELAVLAGDFLLTHSFEVLTSAPELFSEQKLALVTVLAEKSGGLGMIGGQVMDISSLSETLTLAHLEQIHLQKTGALISASLLFGGIVVSAPEGVMKQLNHIGLRLGLAFQIIDDVLDVTASDIKHGISSDLSNDKDTYVSFLGVEAAYEEALKLLTEVEFALAKLPGDTALLRTLARKIVKRTR